MNNRVTNRGAEHRTNKASLRVPQVSQRRTSSNGEHTRRLSGIVANMDQIDPRLADIGQKAADAYSHHSANFSEQHPSAPELSSSAAPHSYPPLYHPGYDAHGRSKYATHSPQLLDEGTNENNSNNSNNNNNNDDDGSPYSNQQRAHTDQTPEDVINDLKRPRACEACRGLKVKCEFDPSNHDVPCRRCAKARRNCIVTQPSRKRQKKTDSRVAELEKKIDALTAVLQATRAQSAQLSESDNLQPSTEQPPNPYEQVTNGDYGIQFRAPIEQHSAKQVEWPLLDRQFQRMPETDRVAPSLFRRSSFERQELTPNRPPIVVAGQKRKYHETREAIGQSALVNTPTSSHVPQRSNSYLLARDDRSTTAQSTNVNTTNEYADVIDRGVITAETGTQLFIRYVKDMAPHMPSVVFPEGTTAADVRKSKPTLFLAIMSAGASTDHPEVQKLFTKEVMQIYADRIICRGEKTLELIQALLVSTIWYWPPEHFEELKFYQLIHLAAVMGIDINLHKKNKPSKTPKSMAGLWKDHAWRRTALPDATTIEARRTWISCYFLCCNAAMGLRRPNLVRWTPYMAECVEVLETSPEAAQSDKLLCQWVRSQHITEEIGIQFSMDDAFASVSIADPKVQYALKGFERDLEHWRNQVPELIQNPLLKMTEHIVNLYMHEIAMHVDHDVEEFNLPFTEEKLRGPHNAEQQPSRPLTPAHIAALSTCLTSIDGIFESFLSLDIDTIRALPVMHFLRIAYAVVVLIKMHFAAAMQGSELGKVIDKDNMKVEQYLDGLLEKFKLTAADDKSRPGTKFLMVLVMLKTWFQRQKSNKAGNCPSRSELSMSNQSTAEAFSKAQLEQLQQKASYSPANTPLQLLSEVATGSSAAQTPRFESKTQYLAGSHGEWEQQMEQPSKGDDKTRAHSSSGYGNLGYNIDPALGVTGTSGYGPIIGDGFEQTIGMSIGDGQLGQYFSDDAFFRAMMEGMPQSVFEEFQWSGVSTDVGI